MKRLFIICCLALIPAILPARVYVSTDKSCYVAGDVIWCSAFSSGKDAVAYLELRSVESLVQTGKIRLESGRGAGSLQIPLSVPTGNYALIAYTASDKEVPHRDWYADASLISIFNTLSDDRIKGGVEIVDAEAYAEAMHAPSETSAGLDVQLSDSLRIRNVSGHDVELCASIYREDGISQPGRGLIPSMKLCSENGSSDLYGETLVAHLAGPAAAQLAGDQFVTAFISFPGDKTSTYTAVPDDSGRIEFHTDCVYGDRDIVCELEVMDEGLDCHFEMESPFVAPTPPELPGLLMSRSLEKDLVRRSLSMQKERGLQDSLRMSLPVRRSHILLDRECHRYVLDDYTRFSTMKELFVEIVKEMHVRKRKGVSKISVMLEDDGLRGDVVWGNSLMLIDGVPFFNQDKFLEYDPSLIRELEIYPYTYSLGDRCFGGVANFVTFKGNMPSTTFDDNVRIYDFKGFSYPESHYGGETACWEPLLSIPAGGEVSIPLDGLLRGVDYCLVAEGLNSSGRAVYAVCKIRLRP